VELLGLLFGLCHLANAVLGVLAVTRMGQWFAMRVNSEIGIVGWTVGLVEVAPIALAYLLPVLLSTPGGYRAWPLIVPVLMVGKNIFFLRWSEAKLRGEFRTGKGTGTGSDDEPMPPPLHEKIFGTEPRPLA